MKKYTLTLALMMILPLVGAGAYEYNGGNRGYYTSSYSPSRTNSYYTKSNSGNYYTNQGRSGNAYTTTNRRYVADSERSYTMNGYESKTTKMRKYFLAHPFFQPLKGDFGSVTDVSYAQNDFKFDMLDGTVFGLNPSTGYVYGPLDPMLSGKQKSTQFTVKEDLSFGITDTLAIIGMVQYDKTKVNFSDWSDASSSDSLSDSGINIYGLGLQYRFVDNSEWIGMFDVLYEHQNHTANTLAAELQAGYKIDRTTIYGLGRLWYSNLTDGNSYGSFVSDGTGDWLMLAYDTDVKNLIYVEGGLGLFSVLSQSFTLNGELIYGHYDWHDQINIKGAIGWQPGDSFALNLYASTALYDSAKNKTKTYMYYDDNPGAGDFPQDAYGNPLLVGSTALYTIGDYKIKNYNEWKVGVQAIFRF